MKRIATLGAVPSPKVSSRPEAGTTLRVPRRTKAETTDLRRRPPTASRGLISEDSSEDRVHMLQMITKVEAGFQVGFRQPGGHFRVVLQPIQEVALAAPDRHGVA